MLLECRVLQEAVKMQTRMKGLLAVPKQNLQQRLEAE